MTYRVTRTFEPLPPAILMGLVLTGKFETPELTGALRDMKFLADLADTIAVEVTDTETGKRIGFARGPAN